MSSPRRLWVTTLGLRRSARNLIRDSQAMHRTIQWGHERRVLWGLPDHRTLVVQHESLVDWHKQLDGLVDHSHTIDAGRLDKLTHIEWALIANPIVEVPTPGQRRAKRRPLPPERWNAWCERKLGDALTLHRIDGCALSTATGKRHEHRTVHRRVLFSGTATVADPDLLSDLRATGVGPGKAYGCGLLVCQEVPA